MDPEYSLKRIDSKLCLCKAHSRMTPLCVDFLAGKALHRRQFGGGRGQLIAKAVGLKKQAQPTVLDVTAGFGQDAFVLASLGCQVLMLERSDVMAALLQDGLDRLYAADEMSTQQLSLLHADAAEYLQQLDASPDVIYMDPMYPDTKNTALAKKEMQVLRDLVGDDVDAKALCLQALEKARNRVVVKRPRHGDPLIPRAPDVVFKGQSSRFDVYLNT